MKSFFVKTIVFFFPTILLMILMEVGLRNIPNNYSLKKEYLDNHIGEIETLILGNSHTLSGLNPYFFSSKGYNAAFAAQSLKYDFFILEKYETQCDNLKTIIIPISYFSLFYETETVHPHLIKNYLIYFDLDIDRSFASNFEIFNYQLKRNLKRLFDYYCFKINTTTITDSGWAQKITEKKVNLKTSGKEASLRHQEYVEKGKNNLTKNISTIEKIIDIAKRNKIKLIFLTTPGHESYRSQLKKEIWDITEKELKNKITQYENCFYINLIDNENFDDADFYDADHLSEKGAEKLSILVDYYIKNLR